MALNERDILGGKAIIFQNDFEVWQFRCWISEEKAYVRKSLKTKDEHLAEQLAEDMFYRIAVRVRNNEKIFGKPIEEAIKPFLQHKKVKLVLVTALLLSKADTAQLKHTYGTSLGT